jgi:hypothetical protein
MSTTTSAVTASRAISFGQIKSKIAEAKRQLQSRPLATAMVEGTAPTDYVRIAFNDAKTNRIDYVVVNKEAFLSTVSEKVVTSEAGRQIRIKRTTDSD